MKTDKKRLDRVRRHRRVRRKVHGTAEQPRLNVYRSNTAIYAQLVDDRAGHTLVSASSLEDDLLIEDEGKIGAARAVGKALAERAQSAGLSSAVFDRGGFRYQGRVAALAEGAREGGLQF